MRPWLLIIGVLCAMVLVGVSRWPATSRMIDGYEVGDRVCLGGNANQPLGEMKCGQFAVFARSQLDEERPDHVAIRDVEVYADPAYYKFGGYGQRAFVLLRLEDDSEYLYWVQCGAGLDKWICLRAS